MIKKIYINKPGKYINQCLANFVISQQFLIQNKNNFYKYKKIYLISKI